MDLYRMQVTVLTVDLRRTNSVQLSQIQDQSCQDGQYCGNDLQRFRRLQVTV